MSEPRYNTGNTRWARCPKCGQEVIEKESLGMYGDGSLWMPERHLAPCGAECWGAGVSAKAYREGVVHGFGKYPCPVCGDEP